MELAIAVNMLIVRNERKQRKVKKNSYRKKFLLVSLEVVCRQHIDVDGEKKWENHGGRKETGDVELWMAV